MSSNDGPDTGSNVFPFPRIGFTLTPTTTPAGTPTTAGASTTTTPDWDAVTVTNSGRRSPLDALNALPDPGLTAPLVHTAPPGTVPDTFRAEPAPDLVGPRLGALSMAAILAVAVAALRGTHTVLSTWWENRQARAAESAPLREARAKHQAAMQSIGDKAAEQRAKASSKVPSSSEFGRKTLGGGGRSGGSGGSGKSGGSGSASGGSSGRKPSGRSGSGSSSSSGRRSSGHASGGRGKTPSKTPGAPGSKNSKKTPTNTSQRKNSTSGKTAPGRGKSPSSSSTSPAMERGRRRQDRTDKRQAARLKRKADRQAARLKDQAKDNAAGRTRKEAAKDARRDARAKARTARAEDKRAKKEEKKAATSGGPTLGKAIRKEAARRLKKRRKTLTPILSKAKKPKTPKTKEGADKASSPKGKGGDAKATSPKGKKPGADKPGTAGTKRPKKKTSRIRWGKRAGKGKGRRTSGTGGGWRFPGGTPGSGAGSTPPPGGGRTRRSPFESAAHTAPTTYTVTSDHVPGSTTKPWEPDAITEAAPALPATGPAALAAAPTTTFPRPGTTRPKEARPMPPTPARQDPRLVKARHQAARTGQQVITQARHMAAEHETEITLDDAIDEYGDFKDDAFKTHSQCMKLAGRARTLRNTLIVFADELATRHNLIGALFSAAMARLAESMDLLARMADEMQTSSLEAAEMAEAADNDLNDAYRPYNTATSDAGLTVPSAPIHNET